MEVILASSSPRRLALLNMLGIHPEVRPPQIDEVRLVHESMLEFVERITKLKGDHVTAVRNRETLVISSDTIVHLGDEIFGKPADRQAARKFLQNLSGKWHEVISGLYLRWGSESKYSLEKTRVLFSPLGENEIDFYLDQATYSDKAGAYGIQSIASLFIEKIEGCYFNVVGLPISLFYRMLKEMGLDFQRLRN